MRLHLLIRSVGAIAAALLLTSPLAAIATPSTHAQYSVRVSAVTTPNQPQAIVATSQNSQQYFAPNLMTAAAGGQADSGPSGALGFAAGSALAVAGPGVLRASAFSEAQAVAQPGSPVGAGVVSSALAEFRDQLIFSTSVPVYQNLVIVSGNLVLTGNMYSSSYSNGSGYVYAKVGGTGLSPYSSNAEWVFEMTRQKSATGVYSPWTPGDPVLIPFSFSVYSGQATEVNYWLSVYASSGASFDACAASGGLCNVAQVASNAAASDYGNTLVWGGVSVTDWNGNPVGFGVSSTSGFDYSQTYVPEPGTAGLLLVGLGWMSSRARRRSLGA